jgi:large subunit ribosomal protein L30
MAEKKTTAQAKQSAREIAGARQGGGSKRKSAQAKGAAAAPAAPKARKPKAAAGGKTVKVRLVRSGIGTPKDQRATLRGLGLTRMQQERELKDTPALRGMMIKVRHLISVDGQPAA